MIIPKVCIYRCHVIILRVCIIYGGVKVILPQRFHDLRREGDHAQGLHLLIESDHPEGLHDLRREGDHSPTPPRCTA